MDFLKSLEFSASIITMIAIYLISKPKISGLWVIIFGQVLWIIYAIKLNLGFFLIQNIFILIFNIQAIKNWKKAGIQ